MANHYPIWREIGYADGDGTTYEEIEVCGVCVPKHSYFRSREDVPAWPTHTVTLTTTDTITDTANIPKRRD